MIGVTITFMSKLEQLKHVGTGHSKYLVTPGPCLLIGQGEVTRAWAAPEKIYFDWDWW